jgi:hypothetical protein
MTICRVCGVEYEDNFSTCPLCNGEDNNSKPISSADILDMTKSENKKHLWELSMILIFSSVVITFAIDMVFGKGIRWSLFAIISLLYLASILTVTHFSRKPLIISISICLATLAMLFLISRLTGDHNWFMALGLPITAAFFVLGGIVVFLNSLSNYKGLNLIATLFLALALFTIVIELCSDLYSSGKIRLQWSVVAAASLSLLALILIFIHYRLKQGTRLGRLFHV